MKKPHLADRDGDPAPDAPKINDLVSVKYPHAFMTFIMSVNNRLIQGAMHIFCVLCV